MRLSFGFFGRTFSFSASSFARQSVHVAGFTNRCADGRYVVFLDYDRVPLEWLEDEIPLLQNLYGLGDVHVFKSLNGFHAICTSKLTLREYVDLLRDSSTDAAYRGVILREIRKQWTLRLTEKGGNTPVYITTFPGFSSREESHPHNQVLRKLYNLQLPSLNEDEQKGFFVSHYWVGR